MTTKVTKHYEGHERRFETMTRRLMKPARWLPRELVFASLLLALGSALSSAQQATLSMPAVHFQRKNLLANYESEGLAATIVTLLERSGETRVFSIWTATDADLVQLQENVAAWPIPRELCADVPTK